MKMMTAKSPLITLNNGVQMPALGLGVFLSPPEQTADAVQTAIADGYRLIDTAAAYGNERQVGEGIRRSGINRSEMFVTTKLWLTNYGYESTLRAFDVSLRKLGLEYLDLYLLHWPVPSDFETTVASYRAAEKLLADGRVRAIGVSNFSAKHLENLMAGTKVIPAVNQVELHPFFIQQELRDAKHDFCGHRKDALAAVNHALEQLRQAENPTGQFREQMGGIFNSAGWGAHFRKGVLFVKQARVFAGARYPDEGCNFELFTNPEFLELETLGPLVELKPGEMAEHVERWWLFGDVPEGNGDQWAQETVASRAQNVDSVNRK